MVRRSSRRFATRPLRSRANRFSLEPLEPRLVLSTVVVNANGTDPDLDPTDGVCSAGEYVDDLPILNGICSLRGAVTHANATAGQDTINFSVSGPINLPTGAFIIDTVTIDGTTAPGGRVEVAGTGGGFLGSAFYLRPGPLSVDGTGGSSGSEIRGMSIHGFDGAITIESNNNTIAGNLIGLLPSGDSAPGNTNAGIVIFSNNNTIGGSAAADRNIISGNGVGVSIFTTTGFGSSGNRVIGNYIGTDVTGALPRGNVLAGVDVIHASGNFIGGSEPGEGNVIADNGNASVDVSVTVPAGVSIRSAFTNGNNVVEGNLIGVNATGTATLGNRNGVILNNVSTNTIRDNVIAGSIQPSGSFVNGFGVYIAGGAGNMLAGNKIGTNPTGMIDWGNASDGVHFEDSDDNVIGGSTAADRNIISGNGGDGIYMGAFAAPSIASGNHVFGNYIGVNATGTAAIGNDVSGVHVSTNTQNNLIGGHQSGEGNVISGNGANGVFLPTSSSMGNGVHSNMIGVNATGTAAIGNVGSGVYIWGGVDNMIGATDENPSSGNVISGNAKHGVHIRDFEFQAENFATGNVLQANYIGVALDGVTPLGNADHGVFLDNVGGNIVGGAGVNPFRGNVISANTVGVAIEGADASENEIVGNYIGVDFEGNVSDPATLLGNQEQGVRIVDGSRNIIGGVPGEDMLDRGNIIAGNFFQGVLVDGDMAADNRIERNAIFANAKIGIDLDDDGVTQNDYKDEDEGPNSLANMPLIRLIPSEDMGQIPLTGTLSGEPNQTYMVDVYATDTLELTSLSSAVQGGRYLDSIEVTTDETGFVHFEITIAEPRVESDVYAATATSTDGATSEFSPFTPDANLAGEEIRTPVIFVPGIFGSFSENETAPYLEFITTLGLDPLKMKLDPLAHFYDDIVASLVTAGYTLGEDLFISPYDWRLPMGPSPIGAAEDGEIEILPSQLADDTVEYGVDYLAYWLKEASEAWYLNHGEALPAVNIVAHSMGGLLSRTYIQSTAYGASYASSAAGRDLALPMVNSVTMFGTPNQGASMTWNSWFNNFAIDAVSRLVMSKVVNHAWHKMLAGTPINSPTGPITLASVQGANERETQLNFLRRYGAGMKELVATYDNWGAVPTDSPDTRNRIVIDLNASLRFLDRVARSMMLYGNNVDTATTVVEQVGETPGIQLTDEILPFTDYLANDPDENEVWWTDVILPRMGDGTVPLVSLQGLFVDGSGEVDPRVELYPFCNTDDANCNVALGIPTDGAVAHTALPANADAQALLLEALFHPLELGEISTGKAIGVLGGVGLIYDFTYYNVTLDPVEGYLVDGLGRRLGYTAAEGVKQEIPGSSWIGGAEGMGIVLESIVEPIQLQLVGLGGDYYVQVAGILQNGTNAYYGGAESSGFLALGETLTIDVTAPKLPGDFDLDGDVDAADFVTFQRNFGATSGATSTTGDMNGDGAVGRSDFARFATAFGSVYQPTTGSSPQPSPLAVSSPQRTAPLSLRSSRRRARTIDVRRDALAVDHAIAEVANDSWLGAARRKARRARR